MTQDKAQSAVNGCSLNKGRNASAPAHAPDLYPYRPRRIGSFVGLPSGAARSRHLLRCVSWKGHAIPCETRLGNCSMRCSTTYIHVGVAANSFSPR